MFLKKNDKVILLACSNQLSQQQKEKVNNIKSILEEFGLDVEISSILFKDDQFINESLRAAELNNAFMDENIKCIFDISGGDLANEIIPFLNYDIIKNSSAIYFGYSDLSVLLNSIYTKCNKSSYYYNLKNITNPICKKEFYNSFMTDCNENNIFSNWNYNWILGDSISGIVIGGNIRCTLKLAGTEFMPSFKDKVLFLESNSGDIIKIRTFIAQYKALGVFKNLRGVILGEFTEISSKNETEELLNIFIDICSKNNIPLIKTDEIGHSIYSKGIGIGKFLTLKKD